MKLGWRGVIFDLKNIIANLVLVQPVCGEIVIYFQKKRAGRGGGGGGQRPFGNFPKNYLMQGVLFYKEKTNLVFVFCNCVPLSVDVLLHLCLWFLTLDTDLLLLNQVFFLLVK